MSDGGQGGDNVNTSARRIVRLALADGTPWRAAKLALVVGTLLVVINQWEALLGQEAFSTPKMMLTYMVPFLVSTYTSVAKDLQARAKKPSL